MDSPRTVTAAGMAVVRRAVVMVVRPGFGREGPGNDQGGQNAPPRAAQRLQKSLDRYPIGDGRAAALMLDMRRNGRFSDHRRAGLIATLRDDHKLNTAQAQRYALLLQSRMRHLAPAPANPPMGDLHGMVGQPAV